MAERRTGPEIQGEYRSASVRKAEEHTYRVVYLSRAVSTLSAEEVTALHELSMTNNSAAGITGLLLHDGGRFLQALEGREEAVIPTMARVALDPRHHSIDYFQSTRVNERQFGTWSMQLMLIPPEGRSADFVARVKESVRRVDDPELKAVFIGFAVLGATAR